MWLCRHLQPARTETQSQYSQYRSACSGKAGPHHEEQDREADAWQLLPKVCRVLPCYSLHECLVQYTVWAHTCRYAAVTLLAIFNACCRYCLHV